MQRNVIICELIFYMIQNGQYCVVRHAAKTETRHKVFIVSRDFPAPKHSR